MKTEKYYLKRYYLVHGQNCGSWQQSESRSCNTHSCTCTVYCGSGGCSIYRPTNWDAVYGVYSCDPSTGTTGALEQCMVNFSHPEGIACNRGFNGSDWYWMCTQGHTVNCFNWGGLTTTCNASLTCGNVEAVNVGRWGGRSCSCSY